MSDTALPPFHITYSESASSILAGLLEGCRSPDSIFISKKDNLRAAYQKDLGISIDIDSIEIEQLID